MNPIDIIYSDEDVIVLNKPPMTSVHGGETVSGSTIVDFLIEKFPEIKTVGDDPKLRPGIVHRLDKDTSGVMVIARNQKSFEILKGLFQKRLIEKTYQAVICGKLKQSSGVIDLPIGRIKKNPLKRGIEERPGGIRGAREAVTEYKVLKSGKNYSLVELKPKTGRMHQLRVHMAALHHPIACDTVYGGKKVCCPGEAKRQMLHAASLSFSFSSGKRFFFEADPPEDFALALKEIL